MHYSEYEVDYYDGIKKKKKGPQWIKLMQSAVRTKLSPQFAVGIG